MRTSTKIIIGVAALATLGVGGFLIYRSVKKKKAAAEIPQDNTFTPNTTYNTPTETPNQNTYASNKPATATPKAASAKSDDIGTDFLNVETKIDKRVVEYVWNRSANEITVRLYGGKDTKYLGGTRCVLTDVVAVQQVMMDVIPEAKTEMEAHGGADGVIGKYTAKWFAVLVAQCSTSNEDIKILSNALKERGVNYTIL